MRLVVHISLKRFVRILTYLLNVDLFILAFKGDKQQKICAWITFSIFTMLTSINEFFALLMFFAFGKVCFYMLYGSIHSKIIFAFTMIIVCILISGNLYSHSYDAEKNAERLSEYYARVKVGWDQDRIANEIDMNMNDSIFLYNESFNYNKFNLEDDKVTFSSDLDSIQSEDNLFKKTILLSEVYKIFMSCPEISQVKVFVKYKGENLLGNIKSDIFADFFDINYEQSYIDQVLDCQMSKYFKEKEEINDFFEDYFKRY